MNDTMRDVVVVDDNPALLCVLAEIFKQRGCAVRTASDGFAALALLRDRVPDLLLSDLNMPGMSGFELLSVVRRRFPAVAVIAMSGAYRGDAVPHGVAADGFYSKGSTTIDRLFEIVCAIDDVDSRQSMRATAPIWVPASLIGHGDVRTTSVACPECLRTFAYPLRGTRSDTEEIRCPHCMSPVQLAVVRQADEMDRTAIPLASIPAPPPDTHFVFVPDSRY